MAWTAHPRLAGCGTFAGVPEGFEAFFTTRRRALAGSEPPQPDYPALAAELGVGPDALVRVRQCHGTRIRAAGEEGEGGAGGIRLLGPADGLVTAESGTFLAGISSDCAIVLVVDPVTGACGMAHSGWRGTAGRIGARLVERLARDYGSRPAGLIAFVAPMIRGCCYEVGEEVFAALAQIGGPDRFRVRTGAGRDRLDLPGAVRAVLEEAGVEPSRIEDSGACTRCQTRLFFSYRAEGPGCAHIAALVGRVP